MQNNDRKSVANCGVKYGIFFAETGHKGVSFGNGHSMMITIWDMSVKGILVKKIETFGPCQGSHTYQTSVL